nr:hypothetical protein [Rhodoferax sp.]
MTNPAQETNGVAKPTRHPPVDAHAHATADESKYGYESEDENEDEDGEIVGEEGGYGPYPKRRKSSAVSDMVFAMAAAAVLAAMIGTPSCIWVVRHWDDSTAPVVQGTVQRILFVGNLGIDSQIDTEQHSFIVHGITKMQKGTHVETRKGQWSYALCDRESALCEDMVRDD